VPGLPEQRRLGVSTMRMTVDLYDASVPVYLRYLARLRAMVDRADAHAGSGARELLDARLAPDMLPFHMQVLIAANFALRACFPLAGAGIPEDGRFPDTFEGLRARIDRVVDLLQQLPRESFEAAATRQVESIAGEARVSLPAAQFLRDYALPNFFFHLSMAYAILRHRGVPLGKADFDGWHAYPPASR
jgi:hypothetical protein